MATLIFMLLRAPFKFVSFLYAFVVLSYIEIAKRLLLPWFPVYQSLRIRLYRSYWVAANVHYPELIHRLPVADDPKKARLVEGIGFKGYVIPGTERLESVAAETGESNSCVVLYAHGGGYSRGEARMYIRYMERWGRVARCRGLRLVFFSVEYPLTDISTHPTQLHCFLGAYRYLLDLQIPPSRVVFMGDSAGAGLTILTGLQLLQLSLPQPAGYVLLSPWLDHSGENFEGGTPTVETDYLVTANKMVPYFSKLWRGSYSGTSPETNPLVLSPEDIRGLTPQLVLVGAAEFALNEGCNWAKLCEKAGVENRLVREWGQMHIYALGSRWLPREVRERTDGWIMDWIEKCLHRSGMKLIEVV